MPEDLTPDLEALEGALAARPAPGLPPDLRNRILAAVRRERADGFAAAWESHRRLIVAAAVAAAMLFWLNVARLAPGTGEPGGAASPALESPERIRTLRGSLPELDDRELDRFALLQAAVSRGRSVPPVRAVR